MPISSIDGCTESHWVEVRRILSEAVQDAGFEVNLVSDADDVGIIQKRIIQNLYDNPIVVCDVSARNPNVMFELGLRLAFDKPTVIVKDDKTSYSFDTSPIEHVPYRRDLRFLDTLDFKGKLTAKVRGTHDAAVSDPTFSPFLKAFGTFKVAKISEKEVSADKYLIEEMAELKRMVQAISPKPAASLPEALAKATRPRPVRQALTNQEARLLKSFVEEHKDSGKLMNAEDLVEQLRVRHPIFKYISRALVQARILTLLVD